MTGSSQGGAVAQIAAVYMNDLKPAVISFGQPPTMKGTCDPLDESRMYRFINTIVNSNEEIRYDPVPFLYDPTGDLGQLGHAIVLGEDLDNVVYFRPDESYYVPSDKWAGGLTLIGVHGAGVYAEQLSRLNSNGTFPIGIAGWSLGFKCTIDEECESARCNQANKCVGKR